MARRGGVVAVFFSAVLSLVLILGSPAKCEGSGQTTADFLNISIDARSAAMGGSLSALAENASAGYWNPGGLTELSSREVLFSHFAWYQDMTFEYVSLASPLSKKFSAAMSIAYVNYGTIEGYDAHDNPTGPLGTTYDMAGSASFGYSLSDEISIGTSIKYITMSIDNTAASTVAIDFGSQVRIENVAFGAVLANIGSPMNMYGKDENLPSSLRLGAALYSFHGALISAVEIEQQFHGETIFKAGLEYSYLDNYHLRAGYDFIPGQGVRTLDHSYTLGMGLDIGSTRLDYAFTPSYIIESEEIHRFSLTFAF